MYPLIHQQHITDEKGLRNKIAGGDVQAFRRLYDHYQPSPDDLYFPHYPFQGTDRRSNRYFSESMDDPRSLIGSRIVLKITCSLFRATRHWICFTNNCGCRKKWHTTRGCTAFTATLRRYRTRSLSTSYWYSHWQSVWSATQGMAASARTLYLPADCCGNEFCPPLTVKRYIRLAND